MKKIVIFMFTLVYLSFTQCVWAFSSLYYLKDINKTVVSAQVEHVLNSNEFVIKKSSPIYAVKGKNEEEKAVIILEPSGNNLFYYFDSNDDAKKINSKILKLFKTNGIKYEQSFDESHLKNFADKASRAVSGEKKVYNFEYSSSNVKSAIVQKTEYASKLKGYVAQIDKGVGFGVYLQNSIYTGNAKKGDAVIAVLKEDWMYGGYKIAAQGSTLYGCVEEARKASKGFRNGSVSIAFYKMQTPDGRVYDLSTEKINFDVSNEGKAKSTIVSVGIAAGVGAALGALIAAISGDGYWLKTAVGAAALGGGMLAKNALEDGVDAEIPAYTEVDVVLSKPLSVVLNY